MSTNPPPSPSPPENFPPGLSVHVEWHQTQRFSVHVVSIRGDLDIEGVSVLHDELPSDLAEILTGTRRTTHASSTDDHDLHDAAGPSSRRGAQRNTRLLVVVDMAEVAFVDSSGVGFLIAFHRRLAERGTRFSVCCLQPQARQVLKLTAADKVFDVHRTLSEALSGTTPGTASGAEGAATEPHLE